MQEKRNARRMSLTAHILIENMNDPSAKAEAVGVEVLDVSKSGMGFICESPLAIGAVYEAHLKIWTEDTLHVFLKVVRIEQTKEEKYLCGTIFIGMSELVAKRIEVYDVVEREKGTV